MLLSKKPRQDAGVDVGAFADIAFLLIIFFILTTTFVVTAGRKMDIPSGSDSPSKTEQKQITVGLTSDRIEYGEDNKRMDMEQLRLALAAEKFSTREQEQRMVILNSRDDVAYERYYKVVMAISEAGGILALINEEEEE